MNSPQNGSEHQTHLKGIRKRLRKTPLLGPLVECRLRDHGESSKQVFVTLLLSTAPFWLGALILFSTSTSKSITLPEAFWSTIWNGELFMCATSLLAPIFWIALEDPEGARPFPSRLANILLLVLIVALASVFFGLGLANNHLKQPFTFHLSIGIFVAAICLLYLSTVYHTNRLESAPTAFREDEQAFAQAYRRHRK